MPIFLSLPVAFLLWSIIAFGTAVLTHAWHTLPESGPAIPVGVTVALGLTVLLSIMIWISHRQIERWKGWWEVLRWSWQSGKEDRNREAGLMHV